MALKEATGKIANRVLFIAIAAFNVFISAGVSAQEAVQPYSIPGSQVIAIKDSATHKKFRLFIKVPPAYGSAESSGTRFPVIYLTDATYNFPMVEGFMRVATYDNTIKDSIIVGISQDIDLSFSDSRAYYYTPIHDEEWRAKTGGGDEHLRFIRDDVIGYVESHFQADPTRRIYVGYSLGGLLGAYGLLTQPDLFANYLLVSPSLWYDDGYIFRLAASDQVVEPQTPVKILISAGELETTAYDGRPNDLLADAQKFTALVRNWNNENAEIKFHTVKDADHSIAFPEPMVKALFWMLKGSK